MALFRCALSLVIKPAGLFSLKTPNPKINSYDVMATLITVRNISTLEITKNITLFSNEKKPGNVKNLQLQVPENKPLVVMFSWMMARKKHIIKYADFYINKGFDVINITVSPWQLLWPVKGTQIVAGDILRFLDTNKSYGPLLVHGFSVGGYVWSEALVKIDAEREKYEHILERISGQVWDSTADITEMPEGLPFAVFPRNKVLQLALKQYIVYHLKTFDKVATCHYVRASQMFHTTIVKAPALFFISKIDLIGTERSNKRVKEHWESMGIDTYWKCWDKSPHVGHFRNHPDEYKAQLEQFIDRIGLTQFPAKIQAKL